MSNATMRSIRLEQAPFPGHAAGYDAPPWQVVPEWPARWLAHPRAGGFALYRLRITLKKRLRARIHVTADERYEFYVDGVLQGRGPERGDAANWFFESFDLALPTGRHTLLARVWALGPQAPWAQQSVRAGFLLAAEGTPGSLLATGAAHWEVLPQPGIEWTSASEQTGMSLGGGAAFRFDCAGLAPHWRQGKSSGWQTAPLGEMPAAGETSPFVQPNRHFLTPATLRPQLRELCPGAVMRFAAREDLFAKPLKVVQEKNNDPALQLATAAILDGRPFTVPAGTCLRGIVDLGRYHCHYPSLRLRGGKGSVIRLRYAESLWDTPQRKTMTGRDQINQRVFRGFFDEIFADGRAHHVDIPWWRAGRFVQLEVRTMGQPLTLQGLAFEGTRYDLGGKFRFSSNIAGLDEIAAVAMRTLQMCSHETHMDCPWYEQLQYVGDTRLQGLLSFLVSQDASLVRKAIVMFDASRANSTGLTLDAYPGQGKLIAPFSLWWIAMIADYAKWRGDETLVRQMLPGAREVIQRFTNLVDAKGLLASPRGWNYVDAAHGFQYGVPPGGTQGQRSGVLQWQLIYTLVQLAKLEEQFGEAGFARQWHAEAKRLAAAAEKHYWDARRQLFADDLAHRHFSQHAQVLAALSGLLKAGQSRQLIERTVKAKGLVQCNIYFLHYLFEATSLHDGGAYLRSRLPDWQRLIEQGFTTFPEHFGATRSECHAWSAHVLFHVLTTIVGVKAIGPGTQRLCLEPRLHKGERVQVSFAHPRGMVHLDLRQESRLEGTVCAPRGVRIEGTLGNVRHSPWRAGTSKG